MSNKKNTLPKMAYKRYNVKVVKYFSGNHIVNTIDSLVEHENMTQNLVIQWLLTLGIESYQERFFEKYGRTQDLRPYVQRLFNALQAHYPDVKMPLKQRSVAIKDRIKLVFHSKSYRLQLLKSYPFQMGFKGKMFDSDGNETMEYMTFYYNNSAAERWQDIPLHIWEQVDKMYKSNKKSS